MLFDQALDIPEILNSDDVTISLMEEKARYNLRLKDKDVAAIKKVTGLKLPTKIGGSTRGKGIICVKLGPDEWNIISSIKEKPKLDKSLTKTSKSYICSVTDISHRNVGFEIEGEEAVNLINVGCPLDLSLEEFPVGKVTRTVFESASIMLLRTGERSFHLECWRSFSPYLRDYFTRVISSR